MYLDIIDILHVLDILWAYLDILDIFRYYIRYYLDISSIIWPVWLNG